MKRLTIATFTALVMALAPWQAQATGYGGYGGHGGYGHQKHEHRSDRGHRKGFVVVRPRHAHGHRADWRFQRKLQVYWADGYLSRWERRDLHHERRHQRRHGGSRHGWRDRW